MKNLPLSSSQLNYSFIKIQSNCILGNRDSHCNSEQLVKAHIFKSLNSPTSSMDLDKQKSKRGCMEIFYQRLSVFCLCLTNRKHCSIFKYPVTPLYFSSVQFSRSVVSDSLQPQESQHARPPCPSPASGVHSDSCPSSQ